MAALDPAPRRALVGPRLRGLAARRPARRGAMVGARLRGLGAAAVLAGVAGLLAACGGSGSSGTPVPTLSGAACPSGAQAAEILKTSFPGEALTLTQSMGTGKTADTLNCTYRSEGSDDLAVTIVEGDRARSLFEAALTIGPANPAVSVNTVPIGDNGWTATIARAVGDPQELVAAGGIKGDIYANVYYRWMTFPIGSESPRPAPTLDETKSLLLATLK